jgi:hypothetical protein
MELLKNLSRLVGSEDWTGLLVGLCLWCLIVDEVPDRYLGLWSAC